MASLTVVNAPRNQPTLNPVVQNKPAAQPTLAPKVLSAPANKPTLAPKVITQPQQQYAFNPQVRSQPQNQAKIVSVGTTTEQHSFTPKLSLDEFAQAIKEKYPEYANRDNRTLAQAMLTKYPQYADRIIIPQEQPHGITSDMPNFTGGALSRALKQTAYSVKENTLGAVKSITSAVANAGELGSRALGKITGIESNNIQPTGAAFTPTSDAQKAGFIGGQIGQMLAGGKPLANVTGSAEQVSQLANLERYGTMGKVAQAGLNLGTRSAVESGLGYVTAKVQGASDESAGTAAKIGAALPIVGAIAKPILSKALPKLLSFTSPVPEEVLQRNLNRPMEMKEALQIAKQGQGEGVLTKVQGAVRGLRKRLSTEYGEGVTYLADAFKGKRMGLTDSELQTFGKLADEFGIETTGNLRNMSVKESLQFYKNLNEPGGLAVEVSSKGAKLRQFRQLFREKMVSSFGGEGGLTDQFLTQYATKAQVHEAADALVKAYKTNNPKAQASALKTLKNAFRESNGAYLDSLKDLEKETGMSILDYVAALQQVKVMAPNSSALGNSVLGKADKLIKALTFPITSPRMTTAVSRGLGRLAGGGEEGVLRTVWSAPLK